GPMRVVAGFASGLAVQWISAETVETYLGNDIQGIAAAATLGILINVPLMFEIPLVALLLLLGMGTAPAATLLFTAAAGGPITFWGFTKLMPKRGVLTFAASTWMVGVVGGIGVLGLGALTLEGESGLKASFVSASSRESDLTALGNEVRISSVTPFTNVAPVALDDGYWIKNYRPGVAVFDYDRDGDLDFYVTSESGHSNFLYRNQGDGTFANVAQSAGVAATESNGAGVVACDLNNDGYQDLYVGARGIVGDKLDYRSALFLNSAARQLRESIKDRLFVNNGNGTFTEITDRAFGAAENIRSAGSAACADVDGDGWLDIYVGNLIDEDFFKFNRPNHPGHYNVLYRNNGDMTFEEVAESAGVRGGQISMLDPQGRPILFRDPTSGRSFEGYDPTVEDANGNRVGDPTSRTHAVLFFDHDDDGDPDLWLANDGDELQLFRNDSEPGEIRYVPVTAETGIGKVGNWMGFAVGDFDGDSDLDVFVTNVGYHLRMGEPQEEPGGDCKYQERFEWGSCLHALLRKDGTREVPGLGTVPVFRDVAPYTEVAPSPYMPPASLDPGNIDSAWEVPTGLAAYDFGYGATFFDFDNDGDQDLYWLGSEIARGAGPGGQVYAAAGRMLRGDGRGSFEDITVRARLLDILGVGYSTDDPRGSNLTARKISTEFHENGKGLAHGDLNGDGFVDLIGTNSSGPVWEGSIGTMSPADGPIFVWMNGGGGSYWINIRLRGRMAVDGTGSNADGIGARVFVKTARTEGQEPFLQVKEARAGSSYISMDSVDLEFGIGDASEVDRIEVLWPSGRRQVLEYVPAGQSILITEPEE
ncbi:MAG: FG-GAP-like repeat-containing protein, partial [Chloroflexi bacterium]|nr:FG-GAP-like repeat-containing protein [Chloroflexota bacterium]